jgi:serine/threonine protein kinase
MSQAMEQLENLFQAAVALETEAQRTDYLSRECPDPGLRREVECLLACHQNPDRVFAGDTIRVTPADDSSLNGHGHYIDKTLDEKYRLERLLGQGGMGAVYLSVHLGTGRYVAVKLITPQFMRNQEFVERFKREARAAGCLRHPNIVDVTDFGVARVDSESVAYLVMEYLDGCTLGAVLAEEKRLPLHWVVDMLEQVCSAVQVAHQRGIIHRDLKPANIWLEPNALGGYRPKVLDFGIAKLAEVQDTESSPHPKEVKAQAVQLNEGDNIATRAWEDGGIRFTGNSVAQSSAGGETGCHQTAEYFPTAPAETLTRVGAILGTPLFMSPEQCRGDALDARSDIYSLGIIAYQMLSGTTPFTGEPASVLRAHQATQPRPLSEHDRKLPKPVARIIMSALEKNPAARPQTAMAFARALRANTENLGALYRRAFALYSEYFPQIISLSLLAHIPVILVTLMMVGLRVSDPWLGKGGQITLGVVIGLLKVAASFLTGSAISGVIAIIVTQLAVAPLKPVTLRAAFDTLRGRWRPFLKTGLNATVRILLGFLLLVVPGLVMMVRYALWAPVVLLEGVEKKAALQRSHSLAARSWRITVVAVLFQALVTILVEWIITRVAGLGVSEKASIKQNVVSELITLSSIFVLPLVSIVIALVYLKMRQLGGEEMPQVMTNVEGAATRTQWEQRMRARTDSRV